MNHSVINWVNPGDLKEKKIARNLYSTPENYDIMKENIRQVGIFEPLIVIDNLVESGNLRLRIAKELGFKLTHNAAFPITIPFVAILTSWKVGDIILDIYSGASTTGEAALTTKSGYVGYEIKPEFIMASKVRLESYIQEKIIGGCIVKNLNKYIMSRKLHLMTTPTK